MKLREVHGITMGNHSRRGWRQQLKTVAPMVVMVVIVAACSSSEDDASPATTAPPPAPTTTATPVTTQPPTTTTAPSFTVDEALAVSDAYFAAHNGGDIDSVFALFTADATFADNWSGVLDRTGWEPRLAWDMAQGETLTSPECTVVDEVPGAVTLSCGHGTHDAVVLAIGSAVIPTTTKLTVTPDGISEIREAYSFPNFLNTGAPFTRWMEANHPEDADATGCCEADTVEESVARGELRALYAQEWAVYLEANACTYLDGC